MDQRDNDKKLIKALYKYMLKKYQKSAETANTAKEVIADVLDPNHKAQVDPDKIPSSKSSVMAKGFHDRNKPFNMDRTKERSRRERSEKGVNQTHAFRSQIKGQRGTSPTGRDIRSAIDRKPGFKDKVEHYLGNRAFNPYSDKKAAFANAKDQSRQNLKQLKAMPKPNLPKSEQGLGKNEIPTQGSTASAPASRPDAGFGKVIIKNDNNAPQKRVKAKKTNMLPNKPKVKGVKRLKGYLRKTEDKRKNEKKD